MNAFKRITAVFTSIIALFCSLFGIPYYATGEEVDMSQFVLTFEDEFDTLNWDTCSGHYIYGDGDWGRRGGYWNRNLAQTKDGNLIIPMVWKDKGYINGGEGWYSVGIDTDGDAPNGFSQKYGYFEVRCILPACADCWAAFWLLNEDTFTVGNQGKDGTEIDIFESPYFGDRKNNKISSNLHFDGYGEEHKKLGAKEYLVKGDPYKEFNTYGLEWNEKEYIFYINGVETFRTSFGGVSQNPEYLILSLEVAGDNMICSGNSADKSKEYDFIIDYVRVYQYKGLV